MARPKASELTERELEVMHVFWNRGEQTVAAARDELAAAGRDLAYTTVATLVRILVEKGFLKQTNDERPFRFQPLRSFEEVSGNLVTDLVRRVFGGSREELLVRLMEQRKLTPSERAVLQSILSEKNRHRSRVVCAPGDAAGRRGGARLRARPAKRTAGPGFSRSGGAHPDRGAQRADVQPVAAVGDGNAGGDR
jgi:predicted transcriptional regulator